MGTNYELIAFFTVNYPSIFASILSLPILSKAKFDGANTVKGPPASRLEARSVSSRAFTRTENSGCERSKESTLVWPRLRGLRP